MSLRITQMLHSEEYFFLAVVSDKNQGTDQSMMGRKMEDPDCNHISLISLF
jgi:hypothetical protein